MLDKTVPLISLAMRVASLESMPTFDVPVPYGWRFYRSGDERCWAEIETSAGERMIFLTDGDSPFATATAWHENATEGRLHWVSVDAKHQGRGLSWAVVSLAMHRLRTMGYRSAFLTTQTASWVAIKVYHRFGFRPVLRTEAEREGWRIVSEKTGIDFLQYL